MNSSQKDLIIAYRVEGLSYQEIAEKTHTSIENCRMICSRANRASKQIEREPDMNLCLYCGHLLVNMPGVKPKKFCSAKCCDDYYNRIKMRKTYIRTCEHCGNEFVAHGYPKKRFCSRECRTLAERKERSNGR